MAFLLEQMTEADHARIFTPDNKVLIGKYCGVTGEWDPAAETRWAIDPDSGTVLYRLAAFAPRDGVHRYLLIFDGAPMVVQMQPRETVAPLDLPERLAPRLEEIRQAIRDALAVHGFFGVAPRQAVDIPAPTFQ